jgi:hypothetical protein
MTKSNYKVVGNVFKSVLLISMLGLMIGCASTMGVNLSVIPKQQDQVGVSESDAHVNNILVLITQGQTNQEFASVSPDTIGSLVMENPTSFKVFHVSGKKDNFNLEIPVDPDRPVSVYVVGDGLSYGADSQWKYYYNKTYDDTLDLEITPIGTVRKDTSDSWF